MFSNVGENVTFFFHVSVVPLKVQEYHSYRSFIPCKKITRNSILECTLNCYANTGTDVSGIRARVWQYENNDRMAWYDEVKLEAVRDPSTRDTFLKRMSLYVVFSNVGENFTFSYYHENTKRTTHIICITHLYHKKISRKATLKCTLKCYVKL